METQSDQTLVITIGLPGSGKTTWCKEWIAQEAHRVHVSRDSVRQMYLMSDHKTIIPDLEDGISHVETNAVVEALRAGYDVVVDNTHLRSKYIRHWMQVADQEGVSFVIETFFLDLDEVIARDAKRGDGGVGEEVIRKLHSKFFRKGIVPIPEVRHVNQVFRPYVPNEELPSAWVVDIDGTLADMGERSPYDASTADKDQLFSHVAEIVRGLEMRGFHIVYLSGREDTYYQLTKDWLGRNFLPNGELHMRPAEDKRKDSVVKNEIFSTLVDRYHFVGAIDDRKQVVDMWRQIGLPCMQVAEGDF